MDEPTNKDSDSLLYDGQGRPESRSLPVKWILLAVLGLVLLAVGARYLSNHQPTAPEKTLLSDAQKMAIGNQISSLYKSESAPTVASGTDPLNYGLTDTVPTSTKASGTIIFSASPVVTAGQSSAMQIYTLDVATSGEPQLLLSSLSTSVMGTFENRKKPNSFFYITNPNPSDVASLYSLHEFDMASHTEKLITSVAGTYKRDFAWSPSGKLLAYNRQKSSLTSFVSLLELDAWETVIVDTLSNTVVATISGAYQPKWSPDGTKLLFLKTDGLYLYTLKTQESTKVLSVSKGGAATAMSMIDLSADGAHLVWTTARSGIIIMNTISSWEPFTLKEVGRIHTDNTEYYWPRFSPDGTFYAVQAIDSLKGDDVSRKNSRMEIRPTGGRTILYTHSLDAYSFNALFTDDWVAGSIASY